MFEWLGIQDATTRYGPICMGKQRITKKAKKSRGASRKSKIASSQGGGVTSNKGTETLNVFVYHFRIRLTSNPGATHAVTPSIIHTLPRGGSEAQTMPHA